MRTRSLVIGSTPGIGNGSVVLSFDNLGTDVIPDDSNDIADECGKNNNLTGGAKGAKAKGGKTNKDTPLIRTKHSVLIKGRLNLGRERLI